MVDLGVWRGREAKSAGDGGVVTSSSRDERDQDGRINGHLNSIEEKWQRDRGFKEAEEEGDRMGDVEQDLEEEWQATLQGSRRLAREQGREKPPLSTQRGERGKRRGEDDEAVVRGKEEVDVERDSEEVEEGVEEDLPEEGEGRETRGSGEERGEIETRLNIRSMSRSSSSVRSYQRNDPSDDASDGDECEWVEESAGEVAMPRGRAGWRGRLLLV